MVDDHAWDESGGVDDYGEGDRTVVQGDYQDRQVLILEEKICLAHPEVATRASHSEDHQNSHQCRPSLRRA